jgi:hypothetical protein
MSTTATAATGTGPYVQTRSGITAFSPFGVGSSGTLPVELLSFTAVKQGNGVDVIWETAMELNNDRFEVERSEDGNRFEKIGVIQGKGTSYEKHQYLYTDINARMLGMQSAGKQLYYRLKQVDYDGSSAYSQVVSVDYNQNKVSIHSSVQPNPFINQLSIEVYAPTSSEMNVEVTDMMGRMLMSKQVKMQEGDNHMQMEEMMNWMDGVYFITLKGDGYSQTHRVVKGR